MAGPAITVRPLSGRYLRHYDYYYLSSSLFFFYDIQIHIFIYRYIHLLLSLFIIFKEVRQRWMDDVSGGIIKSLAVKCRDRSIIECDVNGRLPCSDNQIVCKSQANRVSVSLLPEMDKIRRSFCLIWSNYDEKLIFICLFIAGDSTIHLGRLLHRTDCTLTVPLDR